MDIEPGSWASGTAGAALYAGPVAKYGNQGLDHVAIAVADVERSQRFYADILGLERAHEAWDVPVVMAANGTGVAIFDKRLHSGEGEGQPDVRILHIAFRLDRDGFERAREELAAQGLAPRFSDHGISHSIYFTDPDGHQLELTTYEI
jgi:catechol 2,3-dioxygenase-like lactoylglutathione lyase family enzyme